MPQFTSELIRFSHTMSKLSEDMKTEGGEKLEFYGDGKKGDASLFSGLPPGCLTF